MNCVNISVIAAGQRMKVCSQTLYTVSDSQIPTISDTSNAQSLVNVVVAVCSVMIVVAVVGFIIVKRRRRQPTARIFEYPIQSFEDVDLNAEDSEEEPVYESIDRMRDLTQYHLHGRNTIGMEQDSLQNGYMRPIVTYDLAKPNNSPSNSLLMYDNMLRNGSQKTSAI